VYFKKFHEVKGYCPTGMGMQPKRNGMSKIGLLKSIRPTGCRRKKPDRKKKKNVYLSKRLNLSEGSVSLKVKPGGGGVEL